MKQEDVMAVLNEFGDFPREKQSDKKAHDKEGQMKVYCKECKYRNKCHCNANLTIDYYQPKHPEDYALCKEVNPLGDCTFYEPKRRLRGWKA